jgi:AcrR family transcriptional regulator
MNGSDRPPRVDIRTRRREKLIEDARAVALELFLEQGYENTSIDEISAELGVSPRTLFRHVETKDRFLHYIQADWSALILDQLTHQPTDITLVDAYLRSVHVLADHLQSDPERSQRIVLLIYAQSTSLSSTWATYTSFADPRMSVEIARRLRLDPQSAEVTIFRSMLMSCVVQGLHEWASESGGETLYALLERNIRLLEGVEERILTRHPASS